MTHAQKPDFVFRRNERVHLIQRWTSVLSTTGSRGVRISGSNAGYTMFQGSVKSTGYPLHSPIFPFTSPPVRHRVPSHCNWTLPPLMRVSTCTETRVQDHERERERSSMWTVSICFIMGDTNTLAVFYENSDELSSSYEVGNFFDRLNVCRLSSRS